MLAVELFAGAGGLALGLTLAGFRHALLVDWDEDSHQTLLLNAQKGHPLAQGWNPLREDVRTLDYGELVPGEIDLLAGGPPCQPFSQGGLHRGPLDPRDMFPAFMEAVRVLRPRAFLVENVRGLAREKFSTYLEYIVLGLSYPWLAPEPGEDWLDHLARLEQVHTARFIGDELSYKVVFQVLDAADFGVPQRRERLFIVGFRQDLGISWSFPRATHYRELLLYEQWATGEYWRRHGIRPEQGIAGKRPQDLAKLEKAVQKILDAFPEARPWRTVRDGLWGESPLPDPRSDHGLPNHEYWPGARSYPGHTGSPLDEPAKTIKAGVHGVPGGENMLRYPDGSVRYLTVREAARIQTFPDDYEFPAGWTRGMKLVGNAVAVSVARELGLSIRRALEAVTPNLEAQGA